MRFSNKIPEYSYVSLLPLQRLNNPAEQRHLGGIFVLLFCHIARVVDLLRCLRFSALFILWLICLVFNRRWLWSVGIRSFFRLRIQSPALSPTRSPALSPSGFRAWSPTSTSGRYRPARIFRCKPTRLHTQAGSAHTFGTKLSSTSIHLAALRSNISTLETSALDHVTPTLETSSASALHYGASTLETSAAVALHCQASSASTLEALTESARSSALPATNVLNRSLAERTILASWPPEVVRPYEFGICANSRSAGHSASQSLPAAASTAASTRPGKCFAGQNCQCQHKNDRCCNFCLFHFRFLSLIFHNTAYLGPFFGFFYRDSGEVGEMVTYESRFSGKYTGNYA